MRTTARSQDKALWNLLDALQRRIKGRAPRVSVRIAIRMLRFAPPR